MPFPFTRNVTVDVIASFGDKLWNELIGTRGSTPFKVTSVSLSFSGIAIMEAGQRTIEGFLASRTSSDDQQSTTVTVRDVSKSPAKRPRSPPDTPRRRKQVRLASDQGGTGRSADARQDRAAETDARDERFSFVCDKCRARVWLPGAPAAGSGAAGDAGGSSGAGGACGEEPMLDDGIREDMLAALRLEHADFHFAQELAAAGDEEAPRRVIRPSERPSASTAKRKKKKGVAAEGGGIARFFSKK